MHYYKIKFNGLKSVLVQLTLILFACQITSYAQNADDSTFKPSGKLWGLAYGDLAYKMKSDSLNRGGMNQYTGVKESMNMFQFRRIYLGYNYNISKRFAAEFLLAAEDNLTTSSVTPTVTSGDLLLDNKLSMFVKLANIKWKRIIPGADLSVGEINTPSAVQLSEVLWDYRCIERTISDLRRTPTWDFGASLNGKFYNSHYTEAGYNVMVGNGTASRPENDQFKTFYSDVYAKLFDKRIVLDAYADYTRLNWTPRWHHDRNMIKGIVAYTAPMFTVGAEAFMTTLTNDNSATDKAGPVDTISTNAFGVSIFARGRIYREVLGFFIRYDTYDPSGNNKNNLYSKYVPITKTYDPNTKEQFFTAGIDYSPISKIHIMPNVWYNAYDNAGPGKNYNAYDLVFRLSLYYVYGK